MGISVIIPSRNEKYLTNTIRDILSKAVTPVAVVAVLDGWWPKANDIVLDERVSYIHSTTPLGMRGAINKAVSVSDSNFILKCDAHVMFEKGFDSILMRDCGRNMVMVPRRKRLDPDKWELIEDGRLPVDYEYLDSKDLHGVRWDEKAIERASYQIDDIISAQGSCWIMNRNYFYDLELLDEKTYGPFFLEFQEISFKSWLSGGSVKVNKHTWYAHWHKTQGRGYSLQADRDEAVNALARFRAHPQFMQIINKFMPMPTWKT